jgi:hypothetical protein
LKLPATQAAVYSTTYYIQSHKQIRECGHITPNAAHRSSHSVVKSKNNLDPNS